MPIKRKRRSTGPGRYKRARRNPRTMYRRKRTMSRRYTRARRGNYVRSVIYRMAETKEALKEICHNLTLTHNTVKMLDNNAFYSKTGVLSEQMDVTNGCRIGKKIYVTKIRVALMIENQQYRPQCSYWLYLVRNKVDKNADISSKSDMFEGRSTTIPMDWIDTGKVDVLWSKKFTVRMPNSGTSLPMTTTAGEGFAYQESGGASYEVFTNPQRITKFDVPIYTNVMYVDDGVVPASYRYQWVVVPYDNYSTSTGGATWPIGHISMTTIMQFKDV